MPESMGRTFNTRFLGVMLDDLFDAAGGIPGCSSRLEQPAIMMSGDMGTKGSGKGLSEKYQPILTSFALLNEYLAVFEIDIRNLDPAKFTDPNASVKQQTQH